MRLRNRMLFLGVTVIAVAASLLTGHALYPASAQPQAAPPAGSPAATTLIDGTQLPPPPQKFGGRIERTTGRTGRRASCRRRARPTFCSS